jgi:hypothetical protein
MPSNNKGVSMRYNVPQTAYLSYIRDIRHLSYCAVLWRIQLISIMQNLKYVHESTF